MMVSDEEKRWIVVGIAMSKVAAPVLRDAVKQGMDTNYANLDRHCQLLHLPCSPKTLTHGVVRADPIFGKLKFENINNNDHLYGKHYRSYNFSINDSVDLAKLYLPDYLAQFSAFDDSLDMVAILRLLGFRNYMPAAVFSPHTQNSADDVRENVRNKWGHVDLTVWTDALFHDCFDKLKTLVRSLGLTADVEKNTLDQLDDWQTKGCQLIMGHAVDRDLLCLVQDEVKDLIKDYNIIHSQLNLHNKQVAQLEINVATLTDQDQRKETRLVEHHKRLEALEEKLHVQQAAEIRIEEIEKVFKRLLSFKTQLSIRLQTVEEKVDQLEQTQTKTDDRVGQLEQSQTNTVCQVELLKHSHSKTADEVELLKHSHTQTADEVELLKHSHTKAVNEFELLKHSLTQTADEVELLKHSHTKAAHEVELLKHSHTKTTDEVELLKHSHTETVAKVDQLDQRCNAVEEIRQELKSLKTQKEKLEASSLKPFNLKSCRSKLEDHYQKTATVPTSVWCKKAVVDIRQIYTRLSWVKEEQSPAGTTQSELKHYSDVLKANKDGAVPKRILVQGQTGIGKSTFVKKLLVDWVEVNKGAGDEQAAVLKNFELVVAVNLKEVSKFQSLRDVIRLSNVFAKEDKYMTEGLIDYITNNQEKVLLIFDGYDEYRCGLNSEIYEIFSGNSLRNCCVLITTRISKADELRGGEDLHAEITGFSEVDREFFMRRFLNSDEVQKLQLYLDSRNLMDLAKVPLLLLFFCILWKRGQSTHFPGNKTKLYMNIIQFILNHSQCKQSPPQYLEVISFKEILSEIGKIALRALLKNDHLFEYSQLSDSVRCDESVFIGLLQITEYSATLRPVGMVSFIHKSIQEFLAAWYVTYRCIPKGRNLGEIGVKLEECLALENVFQFICGLSEDGAFAVCRHLNFVRISDPSLDFSQTIPDVENETYGVPLSDVTDHQWEFTDLIIKLFANIKSRAEKNQELLRSCVDCLGGVLCQSPSRFFERFSLDLVQLALKHTKSFYLVCVSRTSLWCSAESEVSFSKWRTKFKILSLMQVLPNLKLEGFFKSFFIDRGDCFCGFHAILCFHNGQLYLYITHLTLKCDSHARLFSETVVPPHPAHFGSGESCLKFLKTLYCLDIDSLCDLLQHVPNPRTCSLSISGCNLTSKGAVELASLLPRYEKVIHLDLHLAECSEETVTKLVAVVKHKTIEKLQLSEMNLTSAAAEVFSRSLPELSALQTLKLSGSAECSDEALRSLTTAIKHKTLKGLELSIIPLTSAAVQALGHSLPELSALETLKISGLVECSNEALTSLITSIKHKTLKNLEMDEIILTLEVAEGLAQALPKLSALRGLKVSSADRCSFRSNCASLELGNFRSLTICGLSESSAEAASRLIDAFIYKTIDCLNFWQIHLTSSFAKWLGQWLPELSALQYLIISGLAECSDEAVTKLVAAIKHKTLERLQLSEISLTSSVADALGQSLPELSALQTLKISAWDECFAEAVTSLISAIKHKSLKELILSGIHLTSAAAEALSQSLPELSALQILELRSSDGCTLLSWNSRTLEIRGWIECSAEAARRLFVAFKQKTPDKLELRDIYLTSAVAEALGHSLPELSALQTLEISDLTEYSAGAVTKLFAAIKHQTLKELNLSKIPLTSTVTEALGQSLSELSALQTLKISGSDGCSLQREEMEALFNRFNRPSSLTLLRITGFTARGSLTPLAKNLVLFPCLERLRLEDCDMSEDDFCGFLEILKFTSNLRVLGLEGSSLGHAVRLMVPYLLEQRSLERVCFRQGDCSEEDLNYVRKVVKERRPQLIIFSWPLPVLL